MKPPRNSVIQGREQVIRAILIAGMPGSGKSYLAGNLAHGRQGWHVADDPMSVSELVDVPQGTQVLVACHPDFCLPNARAHVQAVLANAFGAIDVEWMFLANEPDACMANIRARNDGRRVDGYVRYLSNIYVVPQGYEAIPVSRSALNNLGPR